MKSGFFNHFCQGITPHILETGGFTEYSRRQSPRLLRATPPVGHSPITICPEGAQEFFPTEQHQRTLGFEDELVLMLQRHGVSSTHAICGAEALRRLQRRMVYWDDQPAASPIAAGFAAGYTL